MFRELIRKNKKLSTEECIHILKTEKRGVLSVNGDNGYPYAMPMNHYYNEEDGKIYFHCGKIGHRLDSLKKDNKVSFCTYTQGYRNPGDWQLNIKSVIVFGKIDIIDELDKIVDITTKLSYKFTQDDAYINAEIKQHAHRTLLLQLTPENICGKTVKES
ncbi:MAG: pyridoxamine 5'-phosphate oxidase family protein [Ruminococcaceae bacterium]|nr:pyridoxamine 5'-phosphate oxidase family protein [Oscillospiraceae bacterium]